MIIAGFQQLQMDTCIYTRRSGSNIIILGMRVDGQAIPSPNKSIIANFSQEMG